LLFSPNSLKQSATLNKKAVFSSMGDLYLENVKFLIVDDNTFMRTIIRRILTTLGAHDVREAPDGADALRILSTWHADIMIVDWEMQPLDGVELTRMIRTAGDSTNPFLPIIMLTGYSEIAQITEARDAGVTEYIVKPVSAKALFRRIREIVEHPRPFVKTKGFFGPDRRRSPAEWAGLDKRHDEFEEEGEESDSRQRD
jgi:two-component system, chemotaxis family, chemotaxis protein CheY